MVSISRRGRTLILLVLAAGILAGSLLGMGTAVGQPTTDEPSTSTSAPASSEQASPAEETTSPDTPTTEDKDDGKADGKDDNHGNKKDCGTIDLVCKGKNLITQTVDNGVSGFFGEVIQQIFKATINLHSYLIGFFQRDPVTNPDTIEQSIDWGKDVTKNVTPYIMTFALIIGAGTIALSSADQQVAQGRNVTGASIRAAAAAVAAAPILLGLLTATDALSDYIFAQGGDVTQAKNAISDLLDDEDGEFTAERILLLIIALTAIFAFIDLLIQLFVRQFLIIAGAVILPMVAATTTGEQGKSVWSALLRLLSGLLLFKPVCALIFAFGIRMANDMDVEHDNIDSFPVLLLFIAPVLAMSQLLGILGAAGGSTAGGMLSLAGAGAIARGVKNVGGKALGAGKAVGGGAVAGAKKMMPGGKSGGTGGSGGGGGGTGGSGGGSTGGGGGGGGDGGQPAPNPTPAPAMAHASPTTQPRPAPKTPTPGGTASRVAAATAARKSGGSGGGSTGGKSAHAAPTTGSSARGGSGGNNASSAGKETSSATAGSAAGSNQPSGTQAGSATSQSGGAGVPNTPSRRDDFSAPAAAHQARMARLNQNFPGYFQQPATGGGKTGHTATRQTPGRNRQVGGKR